MAFKTSSRQNIPFETESIDKLVPEDSLVRIYDEIIDAVLHLLGIRFNDKSVGNSAYHPADMLKLLFYSYAYGWRSSRKIERALYDNRSFIWLMAGLKPDHKTISKFRKDNKKLIKKVFKQCILVLKDLNLVAGTCLYIDGSKFRGNASIDKSYSEATLEEKLAANEELIDKILKECDNTDETEAGNHIKLGKELSTVRKRKSKIEEALKAVKNSGRTKGNITDPEQVNFKSRQGSHSGTNVEIVTDDKHGLIVDADVVDENNDYHQFTAGITRANETLGENCKTACADCGFFSGETIDQMPSDIDVIIPSEKQISNERKEIFGEEVVESPFAKDKFEYDKSEDVYICPAGEKLNFTKHRRDKKSNVYQVKHASTCRNCRFLVNVAIIPAGGKYTDRNMQMYMKSYQSAMKSRMPKKSIESVSSLRSCPSDISSVI